MSENDFHHSTHPAVVFIQMSANFIFPTIKHYKTPNALKLCTYFVTKQVIKQAYADLFIRYLNSP